MKTNRIFKISFLVSSAFLFQLYLSCGDNVIYVDINEPINTASIKSNKNVEGWDNYVLTTRIETKDPVAQQVVHNNILRGLSFTECSAKTEDYRHIYLQSKITSFSFMVLPDMVTIDSLLITTDIESVAEYMKRLNGANDFIDETQLCHENSADGCYGYSFEQQFKFIEKPDSLLNKDFRIVLNIKTEDGKEFSDTTEVIRLTL